MYELRLFRLNYWFTTVFTRFRYVLAGLAVLPGLVACVPMEWNTCQSTSATQNVRITQVVISQDYGETDPVLSTLFEGEAGLVNGYTSASVEVAVALDMGCNQDVTSVEIQFPDSTSIVFTDVTVNTNWLDPTPTITLSVEKPARFLEGATIQITVKDTVQHHIVTVAAAVPPVTFGVNALALVEGDEGVLWTGTSHDGLLGLRAEADGSVTSIHYPGGQLLSERTADFQGPRGNMITRMVEQVEGIWLGSWSRGLTWFHPGKDPLDKGDDYWTHFLPPAHPDIASLQLGEGDAWLLQEFTETITALLPDGDEGLWVGTLAGLYYLHHGGEPWATMNPVWTYITDGTVLSLASQSADHLWVGFSTEHDSDFMTSSWQRAKTPLLFLNTSGTPTDPSDDEESWMVPGGETGDMNSTVLSLLVGIDVLWVGTDHGLYVYETLSEGCSVELGEWYLWSDERGLLSDGDILTLTAQGDNVIWIGAFDVCGDDGGGLMRLDHGGTPLDASDDKWLTHSLETGLKDADVSAIVPLSDGRVAFTTFNLDITVLAGLGFNDKAAASDCELPNPGKDGLTILDLGDDPNQLSDDTLFDF